MTRRSLVGLALALAVALPGCGWTPLYADRETGPADADLRAIRVYPIPERIGQRLEFALRNSLNPAGEPASQIYLLKTTMTTSLGDTGIQSQGLGTRGEFQVYVTCILTDIKSNTGLLAFTVHANESFDIQANGYSTVVARDDASNRTVEELRREIIARLTLFMQRAKAPATS